MDGDAKFSYREVENATSFRMQMHFMHFEISAVPNSRFGIWIGRASAAVHCGRRAIDVRR